MKVMNKFSVYHREGMKPRDILCTMHVLFRSDMGNPPKLTEPLQNVLRAEKRLGGDFKPPWVEADKFLYDAHMGGILDRQRRDQYNKLQSVIDNRSEVS